MGGFSSLFPGSCFVVSLEPMHFDAPHPQTASKGFDGLAVSFDESTWSTDFVLLTEDKATDGPRGKFTSQIQPELIDIEAGNRNSQLMSQLTSLAKQRTMDQNYLEHLLETAFYDNRSPLSRVHCNIPNKDPEPTETQIIDGFSTTIQGDRKRRGSELLVFDDLRESLHASPTEPSHIYIRWPRSLSNRRCLILEHDA